MWSKILVQYFKTDIIREEGIFINCKILTTPLSGISLRRVVAACKLDIKFPYRDQFEFTVRPNKRH